MWCDIFVGKVQNTSCCNLRGAEQGKRGLENILQNKYEWGKRETSGNVKQMGIISEQRDGLMSLELKEEENWMEPAQR